MRKINHSLSEPNEKKKISLRVFEYHLRSINVHISKDPNFFNLKSLAYFNGLSVNQTPDLEKVKKLLFNAWSTEFALRNTLANGDKDFQRFSLQWCFPQTYYAIFLTTMAHYIVKNVSMERSHQGVLKEFANQIKRSWYPDSISFSCSGDYKKYMYAKIPKYIVKNSLSVSKYDVNTADMQISQFLTSTRSKLLEARKSDKQNSKNAIKSKSSNTAKKNYNSKDWQDVSKNQWDTTIMDLLYRLRIKANYEYIDSFIEAEYDVDNIIKELVQLVFNLNFVNECFIAKKIGIDKYKGIVNSFPLPLNFAENPLQKRLIEIEKNV